MRYLEGNLEFLVGFFEEKIPQIGVFRPEGTFLVWLDFRGLGMDDGQLKKFLVEKAGLGLSEGTIFGPGGTGFQRLNFACPRSVLDRALGQLADALA
jgi:cystathionine beta-lyase